MCSQDSEEEMPQASPLMWWFPQLVGYPTVYVEGSISLLSL